MRAILLLLVVLYCIEHAATSEPTNASPFFDKVDQLLQALGFGQMPLSDRIINGEAVANKQFPWKVAIRGKRSPYKWDFMKVVSQTVYCGATIISEQWLITAAHCFDITYNGRITSFRDTSYWHARVGTPKLEANTMEKMKSYLNRMWNKFTKSNKQQAYYHFSKIFVHPGFTVGVLENDIALVKLKERIPLNPTAGIEAIPMPKTADLSWPPHEEMCSIAGWGCTSVDGTIVKVARHTSLRVITPQLCREYYRSNINLTEKIEFCAGSYFNGVGVCPGDSGSALVCKQADKFILAGVTSATHGQHPESYPGLFTRVTAFLPWIESVMANN